MVATTGETPVFTAVKEAMFPVPLAAKPIDVVLFVQLYTIVPPVVGLENVTPVVGAPLHTTWLATAVTVAVGFTVIVNVLDVPAHVTPALVYEGVTVIVAVTGAVVVLIPVKLVMFPEPDAARPIDVVLFVQLYTIVPPVVGLENVTPVVGAPLHTTWLVIAFIVAIGFTVII
jgi:hypothetical protein